MTRRAPDTRRRLTAFILATLLFIGVFLALLATSTPHASSRPELSLAVFRLRYQLSPVTDGGALSALHADASSISREECIACHGTMLEATPPLHRIHLTSEHLPGLSCHDCHRSVSLAKRDNTAVVTWVDVGVCKQCHSAFPGLSADSMMKPGDFKVDCTTCHSGANAFRHAKPYLSQIIAPRDCQGCHGGRVLPWTPLHEKSDWLDVHGKEALRVGPQSCNSCHGFGLKFCDSCHAIKPPSHTPRAAWLTEHQDRARAETRACFTCHKANFCKKCHVNHEANWRAKHPAFVKSHGTNSCESCHSQSFCSYCHTGLSSPATDSTATP